MPYLPSGAFISIDPVSNANQSTDAGRAAMLKRLVDAGYCSQLLVSGDVGHDGGPGFRNIVERFPLALMEAGLTAQQVRTIWVENPARLLTIVPPGG